MEGPSMPQGDLDDLNNRFGFHPATEENGHGGRHASIRRLTYDLAVQYRELVPEGRELSLAYTKLEEAMMWANAGIARS